MSRMKGVSRLALIVLGASIWSRVVLAGECDPTFVRQSRDTITVLPTGLDDTENIQCALDSAVSRHRWTAIRFVSATYHTQQLAVTNFVGSLFGAGAGSTVVQNLPNLVVTPSDPFSQAPGPTVKWPVILAFNGGQIGIHDLAFQAVGQAPTTGWSFQETTFTELVGAVLVLGAHANVNVDRVRVEGEASTGPFGYNIINGIFPEGDFGGNPELQSGSFTVTRSTFRAVNSPTPFADTDHYVVALIHNTYENTFFGLEALDFRNTRLLFANNKINATIGVNVYDAGTLPFGVESSDLLFVGNTFSGINGVVIQATFGPDVRCAILGNDLRGVSGVGIYLGPGTYGCLVAGSGKNVNIIDLGQGNQVK